MLRLIVISISLLVYTSSYAQRIKGSDTVLPLTQAVAETYMNKYPQRTVTVTGGGSGVGISSIMEGTTDIAMSSRPIKFSEKIKLKKSNNELEEVIVAYDALAVIVNPSNPVKKLTKDQLEKIFRGKIKNWKEVGGNDMKIIVYSRETSSGTYEFFKESVLNNKNYMAGVLSMPATGAIIQSVSQTKGAIGYVGLAYLSPKVKALSVAYKDNKYVYPSMANGSNKSYPIVRPLFYYYNKKYSEKNMPFINFILSDAGQNIIKKGGYIPVK